METGSKHSNAASFLLAGLVLLTLGGLWAFLPVLQCPLDPYLAYTDLPCPRCKGRGRITLFSRMRLEPQTAPAWESMKVNWIEGTGFDKTNFRSALDLADIFGGLPMSNQKRVAAAQTLLDTGRYDKVRVIIDENRFPPGARVRVEVVER
jgi:hypothetical protein